LSLVHLKFTASEEDNVIQAGGHPKPYSCQSMTVYEVLCTDRKCTDFVICVLYPEE